MKKFLFLVTVLALSLNLGAQTVQYPQPSEWGLHLINTYRAIAQSLTNGDHFVATEGYWTNPDSVSQKAQDYYVAGAPLINEKIRVLRWDAMHVDVNGITAPPTIVDIWSAEVFVPKLTLVDERGTNGLVVVNGFVQNYFHYGTFTSLEGQVYHITVAYVKDLAHPTVSITWGEGSDVMLLGNTLDSFDIPQDTYVFVRNEDGKKDAPAGTYLAVWSAQGADKTRVEVSSDMKNWSEVKLTEWARDGYITWYTLPKESRIGFYRAVVK